MKRKAVAVLAFFMMLNNLITAQWQLTEGIYGAEVRCSVVNDSTIFVGTGNGVYRSTNNGTSWTLASNGLFRGTTNALVVSGGQIIAATESGVFLSTDDGNNWANLSNGLNNRAVKALFAKGTNLVAGTSNGVYYSTDSGVNWLLSAGLGAISFNALAANDTHIFAATSLGVYASTNNGRTWSSVSAGLPSFQSVSCVAVNGPKIVAGTDQSVFLSTNNGLNWSNLGFTQKIYSVALSGRNIFVGLSETIYITPDNGGTWVTRDNGLTKRFIFSLTADGNRLIAGTSGSVFFSNNEGNDWMESTNGLTQTLIYSFATQGTTIFAGTRFGNVYRSATTGNTWTKVTNEIKSYFNISSLATNNTHVFAGADQGLYASTNNGNSWTLVNTSNLPFAGSANQTWLLQTNPTHLFGSFFNLLVRSSDNGNTWLFGSNGLLNWRIVDLVSRGLDMYALANTGSSNTGAVFLSTDNGVTWQQIFSVGTTALSFAVNPNHIFVTTSNRGILTFTKSGTNWTETYTRLADKYVTYVAAVGTKIFVATYFFGVYLSTDNGNTWQAINDGLTTINVPKLIVNDQYVWAGTDIGVFKRPLSELTVSTKENQAELNCSISPNPVANTLTINCSDALIGQKYVVQNVLGATLETAILTNTTTTLSVKNWANGLYFLHLVGTSKTIKFVKY